MMKTFQELQTSLNELFNTSILNAANIKIWLSDLLINSRGPVSYNSILQYSDISEIITTSMDIGTEIKVFIQEQSLTFRLVEGKTTLSIEPFLIVPKDYNADENNKNWLCVNETVKYRIILGEADILSLKDNFEITLLKDAPVGYSYALKKINVISLANNNAYIVPDGTIELKVGASKNNTFDNTSFTATSHIIKDLNSEEPQKESRISILRASSTAIRVDGTTGSDIGIYFYLSLIKC